MKIQNATATNYNRSLQEAAVRYLAAGLSIIPTCNDDEGRPKVAMVQWSEFQHRQPTAKEIESMPWGKAKGLALIAGAGSGGVGILDFECYRQPGLFEEFCEIARTDMELGDVLDRCVIQGTGRGGHHLVFRCSDIGPCQKLAMAADGQVLIELKSQGGYVVVAPTCGYELSLGSFDAIPTIEPHDRASLLRLARSFDLSEPEPAEQVARIAKERKVDGNTRPGDVYNERAAWDEILIPHGWQKLFARRGLTYWRRPGKARGSHSATTGIRTGGGDYLVCFSSNAQPFELDRGYSKFAAYTLLEHAGNFSVAARAIDQKYGLQYVAEDIRPTVGVNDAETGRLQAFWSSRSMSLGELYALPPDDRPWVVAGLLPTRSLNLLVSKPKCGKTTLVRNLARCVATGSDFLGRKSQQGTVIYLALEDQDTETRRHFERMKTPNDAPITLLFGPAAEGLGLLRAAIEAEKPSLVIVDSLFKLVRAKDVSDYAEQTRIFDELLQIARESDVCILLTHHARKGFSLGGDVDESLGSTGISGGAENIFFITKDSDGHNLSSVQRYRLDDEHDLKPTRVILGPDGSLSLGKEVAAEKGGVVEQSVLTVVEMNPRIERKKLIESVEGNSALIGATLKKMVSAGKLTQFGSGKRGDAFCYTLRSESDDLAA